MSEPEAKAETPEALEYKEQAEQLEQIQMKARAVLADEGRNLKPYWGMAAMEEIILAFQISEETEDLVAELYSFLVRED